MLYRYKVRLADRPGLAVAHPVETDLEAPRVGHAADETAGIADDLGTGSHRKVELAWWGSPRIALRPDADDS